MFFRGATPSPFLSPFRSPARLVSSKPALGGVGWRSDWRYIKPFHYGIVCLRPIRSSPPASFSRLLGRRVLRTERQEASFLGFHCHFVSFFCLCLAASPVAAPGDSEPPWRTDCLGPCRARRSHRLRRASWSHRPRTGPLVRPTISSLCPFLSPSSRYAPLVVRPHSLTFSCRFALAGETPGCRVIRRGISGKI